MFTFDQCESEKHHDSSSYNHALKMRLKGINLFYIMAEHNIMILEFEIASKFLPS